MRYAQGGGLTPKGQQTWERRRLDAVERLGPGQWERLEHGWEGDQRWTLGRIRTLIARLFHVGYTVQGVWKLLRRHGWSAQVSARRALERDDGAVEVWKKEVWPRVKASRRPGRPGLLRGRGRPGTEAAEGPDLGTARADPGGAGPWQQPGQGVHRRCLLLPTRPPFAAVLPTARVSGPQGQVKSFT